MIEEPNIWKILAAEFSGQFVKGISWKSDSTEINYNNQKIIFDNYRLWSGKYSRIMTRVTARVFIENNFIFKIYRKSIVRNIEKFFGAQDIEIGRYNFDSEFIIKSNNEFKVKAFLQSREIRNILSALNKVNLEISDKKGVFEEQLPEKYYDLCYYTEGEITDMEQLKSLLQLFETMLDKLFEMKIIDSAHR